MTKQTSIHVQPVKGGSEKHNKRLKDLAYVRKDLSHLNGYWESDTQSNRLSSIKEITKAKTGRSLQDKATPIREAVVVIKSSTTMADLQRLAAKLQDRFGIETFQIAIHKDEGHHKAKTWTPNLHAHMVFDWTDHKTGKSIKMSRDDMAEMQTIVAETLGMERGVSSDRKHLNAVQYKLTQRIKMLEDLRHKTGAGAHVMAFFGVGELAEIRKECKDAKDTIKALEGEIKAVKAAAVNEVSKAVADAVSRERATVAQTYQQLYAAAVGKGFIIGHEGEDPKAVMGAIKDMQQDRKEWQDAAMSWRSAYLELQEKSESQEQNRGRSR